MPFKEINTNDQNLQLIQDNIAAAIKAIEVGPLTSGKLLKDLSLKSALDNVVPHYLGRFPQLVLPAMPNAQSTVWLLSMDSKNITLKCSADCVVSVWIN